MFDLIILLGFLLTLYVILLHATRSMVLVFKQSKIKYVYEPEHQISDSFNLAREYSAIKYSQITLISRDTIDFSGECRLFTDINSTGTESIESLYPSEHKHRARTVFYTSQFLFHHVGVRYLLYPPDV